MNKIIGFLASWAAAVTTALFAAFMLFGSGRTGEMLSFAVCTLLSWSFVILACAFYIAAAPDRKIFGLSGLSFAIIYAVLINIVYYSQLTVVRLNLLSEPVLAAVRFQPGSLFFAFDLLGYGLMALSTLLLAFSLSTLTPSGIWLKRLFIFHGFFAAPSIIFPLLRISLSTTPNNGLSPGTIALLAWCAIFIPIMLVSARYFKDANKL